MTSGSNSSNELTVALKHSLKGFAIGLLLGAIPASIRFVPQIEVVVVA
jgi:hypothetical protein